MFGSLVIIMCY